MANFGAGDPGYKHRAEYFAKKLKALFPGRTLSNDIYDPFTAEPEYYRQLNLGNIPDPMAGYTNSVPTAAAGSNAGTTPPAPVVVAGSTDSRGSITFGTGTTPAVGNMVAVTFGAAMAVTPTIMLTENNSASALLGAYVTGISTTGFTIGFATAPAASQANTVYSVAYRAI